MKALIIALLVINFISIFAMEFKDWDKLARVFKSAKCNLYKTIVDKHTYDTQENNAALGNLITAYEQLIQNAEKHPDEFKQWKDSNAATNLSFDFKSGLTASIKTYENDFMKLEEFHKKRKEIFMKSLEVLEATKEKLQIADPDEISSKK
jgi:hypothetical protein